MRFVSLSFALVLLGLSGCRVEVACDEGDVVQDDCSFCRCGADGEMSCASTCNRPARQPSNQPQPAACVDNDGVLFMHGESFASGCGTCECFAGALICEGGDCDMPADQSCELPDGERISHGDAAQVECNRCLCRAGELVCTEQECAQSCTHDGQQYADGDEFSDDCATCVCNDGDVVCDDVTCSPGCEVDGQEHASGDMFQRGCESCQCDDGEVSCDDSACDEPSSCVVRGIEYAEGELAPDPLSCNACVCRDGQVTECEERYCPIAPITKCEQSAGSVAVERIAIDAGYLTIDVVSDGCAAFSLCWGPEVNESATPSTELTLSATAVASCAAQEPATESHVFDLYPLTEEGYPEMFVKLGNHQLLYVQPSP